MNLKHYIKIDGTWHRSLCNKCCTPVQRLNQELCSYCFWETRRNPVKIHGKPVRHYHTAHYWIAKRLGKPCECSKCGLKDQNSRRFHWANISERYRLDTSDWVRLCASCHKTFDNSRKEAKV